MGIRTAFDPLGTTGNQRGLPFTFTIDTTKNTANTSDNTFIIPFTAGTYTSLSGVNVGVSWGDGQVTIIKDGIFNQENCTHEYAESGVYQVAIKSENDTAPKFNFYDNYADVNNNSSKLISTQTGIIPQINTSGNEILGQAFYYTFADCINLKTITADLFKNCPNVTGHAFRLTFLRCRELTTIPTTLFRYNTKVTTNAFYGTFCGCIKLASIPANLFRYNTEVIDHGFDETFMGCTSLTSVPDNLFLYNTKVSTNGFDRTFYNCTNLISIPNNLFYSNTLCTGFYRTFYGCNKLTINPYIFGNYDITPSIKTTRFNNLDAQYNFEEMFYRDTFTGTAGTSGTPGDYWTWTYQQTPTSVGCYGGLGNISITNYIDVPMAWGGPTRYLVTVNTTPSNASIVLECPGRTQVDNTMEVIYGDKVTYTVSASDYVTQSSTITVTDNTTLNINLQPILYLFSINPVPAASTVTLTAPGYTQVNNYILVPKNTNVSWSVSNEHYITQSGTKLITGEDSLDVTLLPENYTITINPTPSDATVYINGAQRTTATFVYNTLIEWSVAKYGYITQTGKFNIDQNTTLNIDLPIRYYNFTIIPTPSDATVIINDIERTSVNLQEGSEITYSVSAPHYETITDTLILETDTIEPVELEPILRLTINATPSDATIVLTAEKGIQEGNHIDVPRNDPITWSVSKADYVTQGDTVLISEDTTYNITLRRVTYKFEIIPTPQNATVTMICSDPDYVQEPGQNYILAPADTTVAWTVERAGCDTETGVQAIGREPITLPVVLVGHTYVDVEDYTYTETSSGVTITKYVGSGTEIVAPHLEVES